MYHVSLTEPTKQHIYSQFSTSQSICCLIASIAFGMVSYYNEFAREVKQTKDSDLVNFASSKENCRRRTLLNALGSSEHITSGNVTICCDVCSPSLLSNVFKRIHSRRRTRSPIARAVTKQQQDQLHLALERGRSSIVGSSLGYSMLGREVVFPTGCILEIVKQSQYITCEADISSIPGVRKELVRRVYEIFESVF